MEKCILHCDLNNFYASVECLYRPELKEKPVAVCGSQAERHGIVLAKNQIAKKLGIKTGETIGDAKNKCPNLIILPPDFSKYMRFSKYAKEIYSSYTDLVESFGIDECWLDITESTRLFGTGINIAEEIRKKIKEELGITVSIGVSFNKIFAKLGSDMKKPDAITVIKKDNYQHKVWNLPVQELLYVGRSTHHKLNKMSIFTIGDLAQSSPEFLQRQLGKWGYTLWSFANGYDTSPVSSNDFSSPIKSVGNSLTSPRDLKNNSDARMLLQVLSESVSERLRRYGLKGKTIQISIRDKNLYSFDRQEKLDEPTYITREIVQSAYSLFKKSWNWNSYIRSLGVRVTDIEFDSSFSQLSLFQDEIKLYKQEQLEKSIDKIRERFGHYSVQRALMIKEKTINKNPVEENVIFPVSYFK